jgi:aryl-alcohol dehydrogenase-like predicted oxidoreductase
LLLVGGYVSGQSYEQIVAELLPVLRKLQQQGKVRFLGATEKSSDDGAHHWLTRTLHDDLFEVVMVAYNMLNQSAEQEVFPLCQKNEVGVINIYSVRNVFSQPNRLREVMADLKQRHLLAQDAVPDEAPLDWLLDDEVDSLVNAAYRFVISQPAVSTVMTGTLNIEHLEENVKTVQKPGLSPDKLERLRQLFGHIAEPIGN